MKLFSVIALIVAAFLIMVPGSFAKVIVLFDENAASEASAGKFVEGFTSHDAGSVVSIVTSTSFMGKSSLKVDKQQSYNSDLGWKFPIDETPYMTLAWKKDGGKIIMIQMAFDKNWAYRYHCGDNTAPGWPSTELEKAVPADWKMYTRNLTKDFKAGWNLTGLAFTPWDGNGGYYDFILLHSDPNPPTTAVESAGKIATTWGDMKR